MEVTKPREICWDGLDGTTQQAQLLDLALLQQIGCTANVSQYPLCNKPFASCVQFVEGSSLG